MSTRLLALGCGVLAMSTAACESTEQESAQLGKKAAKSSVAPKKLALGSAVVQSLPAGASKVAFQIFLVGNPAGATVQITVAPTAT